MICRFIRFTDIHGTDHFVHHSTVFRRQADTALAHCFVIHHRYIGDRFIFNHITSCIILTEQIQVSVRHARWIVSTALCYFTFFYRLFDITDVIGDCRSFCLLPDSCTDLLFIVCICTFFLTYRHQFLPVCIYIKFLDRIFFFQSDLTVFFQLPFPGIYDVDRPAIIFPYIQIRSICFCNISFIYTGLPDIGLRIPAICVHCCRWCLIPTACIRCCRCLISTSCIHCNSFVTLRPFDIFIDFIITFGHPDLPAATDLPFCIICWHPFRVCHSMMQASILPHYDSRHNCYTGCCKSDPVWMKMFLLLFPF